MPASSSNTAVGDRPDPVFIIENRSITEIRNQLLRQIRSGTDFPVTSAAVSLIGQLTSEREVPVVELANVVLGDYGLTSKLLKLINSVYYLRFGEVTTVSRAIVLLGTDHLRDIALSFTLFERLQTEASQHIVNLLCRAVYAAVVGRRIASSTGYANPEEAFICSLFHTLGEMLTAYYAPQTYAALSSSHTPTEESARIRASLLYLSLGKEMAQGWRFPARIVHCMDRPTVELGERDDIYRLCCIASGANDVAHVVEEGLEPEARKRKLEKVLKEVHLSISLISGDGDVTAPLEDVNKYCSLYGIVFDRSAIALSLNQGTEKTGDIPDLSKGSTCHTPVDHASHSDHQATEPPPCTEPQDDPETVFTRGLREVGDAFLEECPLDDILTIVLETMYRGLKPFGLRRILLLVRDAQRPTMEVRLSLGGTLAQLRTWFSIPVKAGSTDIFNVALSDQKHVLITDSEALEAGDGTQIPQWLLEHVDRPVAIGALPLHIKKISIGLIYLEGEKDFFTNVPQNYFNYLKILHQQAILAIRQR
jgi:eukaryotic-like serine/threonine-protein kinase